MSSGSLAAFVVIGVFAATGLAANPLHAGVQAREAPFEVASIKPRQ